MTYDEAQSALYLALEGLRNASPAIVGVLAGADFQQFVCDRTLMPAAAEKNLPFLEFPQVTEWLCARSEEEGRPVIGLNHLMRHVAEDLTNRIRYAPSMIDESLDQAPTTLEELLKLVHIAPRPHLRQQHSSRRLRAVRAMLSRKQDYEALTGTVKGQWSKLLQHNENECRSLRDFTLAIAGNRTL